MKGSHEVARRDLPEIAPRSLAEIRLQRRHHPRAHLDAHLRRERDESWEGGGDARADTERAPLFALLQHSDCRNTAAVNEALHEWLSEWQAELAQRNDHAAELMQATNPAVIPRNHKVQEAIMAAEEGDFAPFHTLLEKVTNPFVENSEDLSYQCPAEPHEKVLRTFCGT